MTKALVVVLGVVLGAGAVSAQPRSSPARKPPTHRQASPTAEAAPVDPPGDAGPPAPSNSAPAPDAALPPDGVASPPDAPGATPAKRDPAGPPMKTDEKAGTKLEKGSRADVRRVSEADMQAADTSFREGNDQLNNGLFPQAVAKYRAALAHWDHPAIHYNLALALINLDQPIEVFEELNKAVAYGAEPLEKDKFDHAHEYLKLVAGQLANIEVSCDKIGAKVAVDGKDVFIAPGRYAAKVRVGKHTFYADKQGYNARITAPFIGPGETFRIELKLYTADELTRFRRRWQNTWFPYSIVGAGVVVGFAAGIIELSAQSSYDQFNTRVAACDAMSVGCAINTPGIKSLRDSADTKRLIGLVGYGVAGAAVVTGAALLWLNRRQAYQITAEDVDRPPPVAIAPIVSPEVMGAMVQGRF